MIMKLNSTIAKVETDGTDSIFKLDVEKTIQYSAKINSNEDLKKEIDNSIKILSVFDEFESYRNELNSIRMTME